MPGSGWLDGVDGFWGKLLMVPSIAMNNLQAILGFVATDYAAGMIISAVPTMGGAGGGIELALLRGTVKALDFSTWTAFYSSGAAAASS